MDVEKSYVKSSEIYYRALKTIPQASQTFSKSAQNFILGSFPLFIESGKGARVIDVDNNEFIDYILALCPIILGYADSDVDQAIREQLDKGIIFSLGSPLEVELSEKLVELIPCAEKVRFAKNGSDVTAGSVRLARAFTGRERVAVCGYHGWHDWFIGTTSKNLGVPSSVQNLTDTFSFNKSETLEDLLQRNPNAYAAIIIEPAGVETPTLEFLKEVRRLATEHKAVLIYDEIVTGFRMNIGGAQAEYGVTPDLACFGKSMANGMPISALVGRSDIMDCMEKVFVSGTFGGELLSIAAAIATVNKIQKKSVLENNRILGERLKKEINSIFKNRNLIDSFSIGGGNWRPVLKIENGDFPSQLLLNLIRQELSDNGIIFGSGFNLCFSHFEEGESLFNKTMEAWDKTSYVMSKALASGSPANYLRGESMCGGFQVR